MVSRLERRGWIVAFLVLMAFAVPWFWWGNDELLFGLPVWLVYHIAWLGLAALTFAVFARRAWGLGIAGGEPW